MFRQLWRFLINLKMINCNFVSTCSCYLCYICIYIYISHFNIIILIYYIIWRNNIIYSYLLNLVDKKTQVDSDDRIINYIQSKSNERPAIEDNPKNFFC